MKKRLLVIFAAVILLNTAGSAGISAETSSVQYSKIFEKVNSPKDLKRLSLADMNTLAEDIRTAIINRVETVGGHLGPDLGIVEATIAMHYVFDSPKDKFVYDVSHQIYPHKILTGRKTAFTDPLSHPEISGYSNPKESPHDNFILGHTSTSLSLSTGLAKARDLKGEKYNVVNLIGDGSLSGGEAFEGLNNAAVLGSNFMIILNDNDMSIAPVQGGLYKNLTELRETNGKAENNIFKAMGFDYYYVDEGNNIEELINAFQRVKDIQKPVVVHIHTIKGLGYEPAVRDKETYHWQMPGFKERGSLPARVTENYNSITSDYILEKYKKDPLIVAISAATPGATGFTKDFRAAMGKNYTDVGIEEEHAVAYASGLAANGAKPILAIMSSFVQRTYDQLSQDLALNNSPATILIYGGSISPGDATHLGIFDIALISNIPNIVYLAPVNKEEYLAMLNWSINQKDYPVVIRVPVGKVVSAGTADKTDYSVLNKYKVENAGEKVAIIGAGNFYELGRQVQKKLKEENNINATLINPRFLSGVDEEVLNSLKKNHTLVITLEDGVLDGGYGEKISRFYSNSDMKVLNYGAKKEFTDRVPVEELYRRYRLTPDLIIEDIVKCL